MAGEMQVRQGERPVGAYVAGNGSAGCRPAVDRTPLGIAAPGTVAVSVVAVSAAVALRRRPVIGSVTMGPGGWVSFQGVGPPPLRDGSPRPWRAHVLRAHRLEPGPDRTARGR